MSKKKIVIAIAAVCIFSFSLFACTAEKKPSSDSSDADISSTEASDDIDYSSSAATVMSRLFNGPDESLRDNYIHIANEQQNPENEDASNEIITAAAKRMDDRLDVLFSQYMTESCFGEFKYTYAPYTYMLFLDPRWDTGLAALKSSTELRDFDSSREDYTEKFTAHVIYIDPNKQYFPVQIEGEAVYNSEEKINSFLLTSGLEDLAIAYETFFSDDEFEN